MPQPLHYLEETASQTAGPFVHIGLVPEVAGLSVYDRRIGAEIAAPSVPGERIVVEGTILDGTGAPVTDAVIETWQADPEGRYATAAGATHPGFRGFGRVAADLATGLFRLETVKPGIVTDRAARLAPHIALLVMARGINLALATRLYFADEAEANGTDPVLARVPPGRRETLIAHHVAGSAPSLYRFDIRLQGEGETVFFDM